MGRSVKHRIAYRLILSASLLLLLSDCTSTIVGTIKKQPAFNWTFIPHELKVGQAHLAAHCRAGGVRLHRQYPAREA